jgi:hypothetical protein
MLLEEEATLRTLFLRNNNRSDYKNLVPSEGLM